METKPLPSDGPEGNKMNYVLNRRRVVFQIVFALFDFVRVDELPLATPLTRLLSTSRLSTVD